MEFSLVDWILVISGVLGAFYLFATWNYDFFKKKNIRFATPIPFFGSMYKPIFRKISFAQAFQDIYNLFPEEKFTGFFEFKRPIVMLKDPELLKQIMIKDYDKFLDHRFVIDGDADPLFGRNLFVLKGQEWRDMRVTLSPAFTGSKMRAMYSLTDDCAVLVVDYVKQQMKNGAGVMELKELYTRFATDVIATSAFGVKTDSFNNKNNDFYEAGLKISTPTFKQNCKFFAFTAFPAIAKALKIALFDKKSSSFFRTLIKNTMAVREKGNVYRPDMIHLLMQARKGTLKAETQVDDTDGFATVEEHLAVDNKNLLKKELTDDDITSQAMIFFFAGFDSVSTLMCFATYEITINNEIQSKLRAEIDEALKQNKTVTYEVIQKLKYLDMIISETLRKWPTNTATDRCCVKPYTIYDGEKSIKFNPGDAIFIPIHAIQHDAANFPNPDKFDPERFNDENKHNIKPGTFLAFGAGPRNCIGSRFAIMEAKAIIFHLVANFNLKICAKTQIPMKLSKSSFNLLAEKGFWTEFQPRTK